MAGVPVRYRTAHEDSDRWDGFVFRPGDIVISTRSRSGTTWVQMICALLIFQTPDLHAPLSELSPWLDWLSIDRAEVLAALAAQEHRRFIKTHTPLDGLPLDPRATYVVVARHPLDMAVSLYHHYANLDVRRITELAGQPDPGTPTPPVPLREWLLSWIAQDCDPRQRPDSLSGVMRISATPGRAGLSRTWFWCTTTTWWLTWKERCGVWPHDGSHGSGAAMAGPGKCGDIRQHAVPCPPSHSRPGRDLAEQHRFLPAGTTGRGPRGADSR